MVLTLTDLLFTIVSNLLVPCSLLHKNKELDTINLALHIYIYIPVYHRMAGSLALEI